MAICIAGGFVRGKGVRCEVESEESRIVGANRSPAGQTSVFFSFCHAAPPFSTVGDCAIV